MKVSVIYKDNTEHAREVTDYLRDFERQTGIVLETIDPDTANGAQLCRTYDIVEYPSIIATTDDGVLQHLWRGRPLPLINEVSYYVRPD